MIDTDKYEGHAEGPWKWSYSEDVVAQLLIIPNGNDGVGNGVCIGLGLADAQLIADAPDLLAEVKRLHTEFQEMLADFQNVETDVWRMRYRIEAILKGEY